MDFSQFPTGSSGSKPSPRREIQGPRPTPLKVRKDSYKVKKPPVGPPQPVQHRPPVIIYTVSPKIIHTNPTEFMSLVQRLTGPSASSSNISIQNSMPTKVTAPDQRLFRSYQGIDSSSYGAAGNLDGNDLFMTEMILSPDQQRLVRFEGGSASTAVNLDRNSGILSPMPASLPMISPNFFSNPTVDANSSLNFMHDLSPINNYYNSFGNTRNFVDNCFLMSPTNLLSASVVPSPAGGYWDLFNQYNNKEF